MIGFDLSVHARADDREPGALYQDRVRRIRSTDGTGLRARVHAKAAPAVRAARSWSAGPGS